MLPSTILAGLLAVAQVPEPPAPAAEITWRAPPSCPGRSSLVRAIETRLGRSLRAGELGIDGVVDVHATAPRYRLRLRLRVGGRGDVRTLSAETCSALADATAVLVALAVEASPPAPVRPRVEADAPTVETIEPVDTLDTVGAVDTVGAGAVPEPLAIAAPIVEAPASAEPPILESSPAPDIDQPVFTVVAAPRIATPPASRRPGGFVRLHGGPELGALPGVTGLVGLATGLLWRRARLELQGLYLAPRTARHPLGDVRASLAAGAVHGCARVGRGRLEVPLCGGLELGGMRGTVDGGSVRNWWLGAVLGAGVALHLTRRVSLWGALQMVGTLIKPDFVARDPGPRVSLLRAEPVTGRLLLGVELRFSDPR